MGEGDIFPLAGSSFLASSSSSSSGMPRIYQMIATKRTATTIKKIVFWVDWLTAAAMGVAIGIGVGVTVGVGVTMGTPLFVVGAARAVTGEPIKAIAAVSKRNSFLIDGYYGQRG